MFKRSFNGLRETTISLFNINCDGGFSQIINDVNAIENIC